ncbi:hypothetical protein JZ751_029573 [Albula glossodonta]|uniref:C-type lectin domain-containing protein n=1 Tax=Albula glossodonta TaxID=121402 RepID=A0A8T2MWG2_9TELE|nr:hypothetical protein JZ751_029573 [Albula glossodonta]
MIFSSDLRVDTAGLSLWTERLGSLQTLYVCHSHWPERATSAQRPNSYPSHCPILTDQRHKEDWSDPLIICLLQVFAESCKTAETTLSELHAMSIHRQAAAHKIPIIKPHQKQRPAWCRAHRNWTLYQWNAVLCSDESLYTLSQSDRQHPPLTAPGGEVAHVTPPNHMSTQSCFFFTLWPHHQSHTAYDVGGRRSQRIIGSCCYKRQSSPEEGAIEAHFTDKKEERQRTEAHTNKDIEEEEGEMKAASALVLVFLLVSVAAMTIEKRLKKFFPPVCKNANGTNWYKVGCYCVQHFKGPVDFATAESNCARQAPGGHLVSLHSEQENAAVLSIIMKYSAKSPRTWMGGLQIPSGPQGPQGPLGRKSHRTTTYIWTDGSPWDYQAWVPGEPRPTNSEHCVEMNWKEHGKWNDLACWKKLGYMCAFKPQAATEGGGQE